jgi:hypothetical protein
MPDRRFPVGERQNCASLPDGSYGVSLNTKRAQWIVKVKVQALINVHADQPARRPDVRVIRRRRVVSPDSHLRDRLLALSLQAMRTSHHSALDRPFNI